jgi:hypothetical protein
VQNYLPLSRLFSPTAFTPTWISSFSLENGHQRLAQFFDDIQLRLYPDALEVTEIVPLMEYIFSLMPENTSQLSEQDRAGFKNYLQDKLDQNRGSIQIQKATGMFIACKSA